jgi:hypothetical protein
MRAGYLSWYGSYLMECHVMKHAMQLLKIRDPLYNTVPLRRFYHLWSWALTLVVILDNIIVPTRPAIVSLAYACSALVLMRNFELV